MDWVVVNKSKFESYNTNNYNEVYGSIEYGKVYIIPTIFNRILEEEGYNASGF